MCKFNVGLQNTKGKGSDMDTNGLSAEQQALLASIMGKSSQAGGGGFNPSTPASAGGAAPLPADNGKMATDIRPEE